MDIDKWLNYLYVGGSILSPHCTMGVNFIWDLFEINHVINYFDVDIWSCKQSKYFWDIKVFHIHYASDACHAD